jgi:hypothetical protein
VSQEGAAQWVDDFKVPAPGGCRRSHSLFVWFVIFPHLCTLAFLIFVTSSSSPFECV